MADWLIRPLESAYPPFRSIGTKAEAVVVLGGGEQNLSWVPAAPGLSDHSISRLVAAIEIARTLRFPLIVSGGSGLTTPHGPAVAEVLADTAVRLGFTRQNLIIESGSRNTRENAAAVKALIPGKTIFLVSSAFHLKRAIAVFRKNGFTVLPAPADYRSSARPWSPVQLIPRAESLSLSSTALVEHLGLAWYGMTGKL